jgi:hypothetical protein
MAKKYRKVKNWFEGDANKVNAYKEEFFKDYTDDRGYDTPSYERGDEPKKSSYSRSLSDGTYNAGHHAADVSDASRSGEHDGIFHELYEMDTERIEKSGNRKAALDLVLTIAGGLAGKAASGTKLGKKVLDFIPSVVDKLLDRKGDEDEIIDTLIRPEAPIEELPDGKPNIITDDNGVRVPEKLSNVDDTLDSASSHVVDNVGTDNISIYNISPNSRGSNLARLAITGFDLLGNLLTNEQYKRQQQALINQMNEYNTPANQMQRFKDAGLNPNLMAGQISAGNQSSSGEPHAMQLHPIDALTAVSNVNLQAAQADEIRERAIAQRNANSLFAYDSVLKALSIDELQSRINKQIKDLEMMESQKKLNEAQTQTLNELRQYEVKLKEAQAELAKIQHRYTSKNAAGVIGKGADDIFGFAFKLIQFYNDLRGKTVFERPDILKYEYD